MRNLNFYLSFLMCFFQFFYTENISVYINDFLKIKMGGAVGQKKNPIPLIVIVANSLSCFMSFFLLFL